MLVAIGIPICQGLGGFVAASTALVQLPLSAMRRGCCLFEFGFGILIIAKLLPWLLARTFFVGSFLGWRRGWGLG